MLFWKHQAEKEGRNFPKTVATLRNANHDKAIKEITKQLGSKDNLVRG